MFPELIISCMSSLWTAKLEFTGGENLTMMEPDMVLSRRDR